MINCIFDFNGTMMFDGDIQNNSWRKYLETKINRPILEDEFQKYVHGKNIIDTFKYFLNIECSPEEALKIGEEKEVIYRKMCLESPDFKLAVGLVDFLDYLKEKGIDRNIATASAFPNVKFFFDHLDLDNWFDINNVAYNDGIILGKPDPSIFLLAAKNINVDIQDSIIFEDSYSGIEAAKRADAKKIVVVDSMKNNYAKKNNMLVIKDFREIERLIQFINS